MTNTNQVKDLFQLFSILHQYVSAGVNPLDGIALYAQNSRPSVKAILEDVLVNVRKGNDLPTAMEKHPEFFPSFITQMLIAIFKITNSSHNKKTIPYNQMV